MTKIYKSVLTVVLAVIAANCLGPRNQKQQETTNSLTTKEALIDCKEKSSEPRIGQRGEYRIFYNYVPMSERVKCSDIVTLVTHADYNFLSNLVSLVKRWLAPISIAVYAPGTDFQLAVDSIIYSRNCFGPLVSRFVTFHVYYSSNHVPSRIPGRNEILSSTCDCSQAPPWKRIRAAASYKYKHQLVYPINVGRNIAKEAALTHFILVADIELHPSKGLAKEFIGMIKRNNQRELLTPNRKVFVLPPFEVVAHAVLPFNKTQLMKMFNENRAFPFHDKICAPCHRVPGASLWYALPQTNTLNVSFTAKRTGLFEQWEPVYIGTDEDPIYDEAITWDGQSDKRIQGWLLCALNYDFLILNNAFVVHRAGVKKHSNRSPRAQRLIQETNSYIRDVVVPEYQAIYGPLPQCSV